jgi:hypothetical protein
LLASTWKRAVSKSFDNAIGLKKHYITEICLFDLTERGSGPACWNSPAVKAVRRNLIQVVASIFSFWKIAASDVVPRGCHIAKGMRSILH